MIINYIKEILKHHRNGISLETLQGKLSKKNITEPIKDIINRSELFTLYSGVVFLKSTLLKCKKDFLKEFEDYLQGKVTDKKLREDIINNFLFTIPDILFINWLEISLDRKLIIFELLFNMMIKPKNLKNKLRLYFNELIEFYSVLTIYTLILFKNYENDFNIIINIMNDIESYERSLKDQIFLLLTKPDSIRSKVSHYEKEFFQIEKKLRSIIKKSFFSVLDYSPQLLKRIINNELKDFDLTIVLTRFEDDSFFNYINTIISSKLEEHRNLFKDLGL